MRQAQEVATWSKDPSTKVGCVVVDDDQGQRSMGFNGLPRKLADTYERLHNRALKYRLICHAEKNAIGKAARIGVSLCGCTLYCSLHPCSDCALLIVQVGIKRVVCPAIVPQRWEAGCSLARDIFAEVGVIVDLVAPRQEDLWKTW